VVTPVPESVLAEVVADISRRLSDPKITETMVGGFVSAQGQITQYLSAKASKLGGAEGIVQTVFHAAILLRCAEIHTKRHVATIGFDDLDSAAQRDTRVELKRTQPAFGDYIITNVESEEAQKALFLIALAIDSVL
jgi:hypothetical protein